MEEQTVHRSMQHSTKNEQRLEKRQTTFCKTLPVSMMRLFAFFHYKLLIFVLVYFVNALSVFAAAAVAIFDYFSYGEKWFFFLHLKNSGAIVSITITLVHWKLLNCYIDRC